MSRRLLLLIGICSLGTACTKAQWYNAIQTNQREQCEKLQEPQRSACEQQHNKSYINYQQDLNELKRDS